MRIIHNRTPGTPVEIIGTNAERLSLAGKAGLEDHCEFHETDTSRVYRYVGGTWRLYHDKYYGLPYRFFLTQAGNNTGIINLNGNYSAAPIDFYYEAVDRFEVHTLLIALSDDAKFNQGDYGAIPGGLTNGIGLFIKPFGLPEIRLLTNENIKANHEFFRLTEHIQLTSFFGNPQTLSMNINIHEDFGTTLSLSAGDRLIMRLNDDFTGLVSQTFMIRGTRYFT